MTRLKRVAKEFPGAALPSSPAGVFKPWYVRRADGGCQVLFPLSELDTLVEKVKAVLRKQGWRPPEKEA